VADERDQSDTSTQKKARKGECLLIDAGTWMERMIIDLNKLFLLSRHFQVDTLVQLARYRSLYGRRKVEKFRYSASILLLYP